MITLTQLRKTALAGALAVAMTVTGWLIAAPAAHADDAGITWTSQTSAADNTWNSVTYGNGLFVAVAETGTGNRVMTSPDGITWTSRTSATDNNWFGVTYGNGLFVAVSFSGNGNRVMTSPDGITWTSRTSATDSIWASVTYGGGLFVAVSQSGTGNRVMTSPDGITWTIRTSATDNNWYNVTYGNGLFVAVAGNGIGNRVMTSGTFTSNASSDPSQWITVSQALPLPSTGSCTDVQDADYAYGTGLTGGWTKAWEPWVNTTLDADGNRIGGWACTRTLINKGGQNWMIG